LRVLKLDLWFGLYDVDDHPVDAPRSRAQPDTRAIERQRSIQEVADSIFWRNDERCPDLKVIVIGSYGPEDEDEGVHHFLRSNQIEVDDELTAVALPVKRHLVKYHEPCSEILEREAFGFTKMRPSFEFQTRTIPWTRHT
jgi:hypothetical protein